MLNRRVRCSLQLIWYKLDTRTSGARVEEMILAQYTAFSPDIVSAQLPIQTSSQHCHDTSHSCWFQALSHLLGKQVLSSLLPSFVNMVAEHRPI